jgi:hypothetical protein
VALSFDRKAECVRDFLLHEARTGSPGRRRLRLWVKLERLNQHSVGAIPLAKNLLI